MRRRYLKLKEYNNSNELKNSKVGDYLYDDFTSIDYNLNPEISGVIGVVFYKDDKSIKVISLEDASKSHIKWSYNNTLVPSLTNIINQFDLSSYFNGKEDTYKIVSYLGDQEPAAYTCYNYSTSGTEISDWYLPSSGDMIQIYENRILLDTNLKKVGGSGLHLSDSYQRYYHTSTQYNNLYAWELMINASSLRITYGYEKNSSSPNRYSDYFYARPILNVLL